MKQPGFRFILIAIIFGLIGFLVISALLTLSKNNSEQNKTNIENNPVIQSELERDNSNFDHPSEDDQRDLFLDKADTHAYRVFESILDSDVQESDPFEIAKRFKGFSGPIPEKIHPDYTNGEMRGFWVLNVDTNEYARINARLIYQTPHLYFWIQEGIEFDKKSVIDLSETFEKNIYPTTRAVFGSESTPGVDGDEHLTILYAQGLGGVAGNFSATDAYPVEIENYSNESEMFYLSADYARLDSFYTYSVLAHEFQHMILWYVDRNEDGWLNEGLSELSVDLNGFTTGGFDYIFSIDPDIQLNFWPGNDQGDSTPHYGASYLFTRYLYDRFGLDFIAGLVSREDNGFSGLDKALNKSTQNTRQDHPSSEQVFQDWTLANILQNPKLSDGRYGYLQNFTAPEFKSTEIIDCQTGTYEGDVNQFGVDYLQIECDQDMGMEIRFPAEVSLMPVDPASGDHYVWSNYGHESHMVLSQSFDFRGISSPILLTYKTWFDIERDYDYLFLTAKTNDGDWVILEPSGCTTENPTGANLGCAYNGQSETWIEAQVDLSKFAGTEVQIQFEYITDAAVNGDGFLIDDIGIDAIKYFSDFEENMGGWLANGFVRVQNRIPQFAGASLFRANLDSQPIQLIKDDSFLFKSLDFSEGNPYWLAISGLSRITRQPLEYEIVFK